METRLDSLIAEAVRHNERLKHEADLIRIVPPKERDCAWCGQLTMSQVEYHRGDEILVVKVCRNCKAEEKQNDAIVPGFDFTPPQKVRHQ